MFVNGLGRNEQNSYKRPSIDASYQVSFIWPSAFRGENRESKLDFCFQDLSMLCAKYQSSGIAGSQEDF